MKTPAIVLLILLTSAYTNAQPVIWNIERLNEARLNQSANAVSQLRKEADAILSKSIATVMEKPMAPPSGNKHDYMSMGRYWWPDPNTKDGLPYIRKDGVSNPEIEKLDRMPLGRMTYSVKLLSLAYYITGDEKYAAKAVHNIDRWFLNASTRMNPHLNYGQTIPGINNGLGRGEGIIDTYSLIDVVEGVELLRSSKNYTSQTDADLKAWFAAYLDWMLSSPIGNEEYAAKNNHGTAFDIQVVRYALFVGNEQIARKFLDAFPAHRLYVQIEPDGSQPLELARTTAFGYSVFNLDHIIDMCRMGKKLGYDFLAMQSNDGRSVKKALDFLLPYAGKQVEDFPYRQINNWDKVQRDYAVLLFRADKLLASPIYRNYYEKEIAADVRNFELIIL